MSSVTRPTAGRRAAQGRPPRPQAGVQPLPVAHSASSSRRSRPTTCCSERPGPSSSSASSWCSPPRASSRCSPTRRPTRSSCDSSPSPWSGGILAASPAASTCVVETPSPARPHRAVALLAAVFPVGKMVKATATGSRLGPLQFQPSEFAKLALVLVGALDLRQQGRRAGSAARRPALPRADHQVVLALVLGRSRPRHRARHGAHRRCRARRRRAHPSGSSSSVGPARRRHLFLVMSTSSNRTNRITNWLDPTCQSDPDGWCGQSVHGSTPSPTAAGGASASAPPRRSGVALGGPQRLHLRHHR